MSVSDSSSAIRAVRVSLWLRENIFPISLILFVAALALNIIYFLHYNNHYIWIDEGFTLWVSDPSHSFMQMQTHYLRTETNPPLHYWLMYAVRQLIPDGKTAGVTINVSLFVLTLGGIFGLCSQQKRPILGLWLCTAILLCSETFISVLEVRAYFLGECLCALATCLAILSVINGKSTRTQIAFAFGLGLLCGISHIYGAIYGGALAAALVILGLTRRQYSIAVLGLAFGIGCVISFGLWWAGLQAATHGELSGIAWLKGNPFANVLWTYLIEHGVGPQAMAWIGLAGLALAVLSSVFRRALQLFVLTLAVFAILPFIGSQFYPMITPWYLLLAEPPLLMLLAYAVYALASHIGQAVSAQEAQAMPTVIWPAVSLIGGLVALFSVLGSFDTVRTPIFPYWSGIDLVKSEAAHCPSGTVRVVAQTGPGDTKLNAAVMWTFNMLLAPAGLKAEDSQLQTRDVSNIDCRVVGWAEHLYRADVSKATPASETEALNLLNLTNRTHMKLKIVSHYWGFVMLKADQGQTQRGD